MQIDFVGPLLETPRGNTYIFTLVDSFTRFGFARAVPAANAENATKAFVEFCHDHSFPVSVHSDRGSHFTADLFTYINELLDITGAKSIAYRPQSNGKNERSTFHSSFICVVFFSGRPKFTGTFF